MENNVRTALVNLLLHSLCREISAKVNETPANKPDLLFPYRANIETLLNIIEETQIRG